MTYRDTLYRSAAAAGSVFCMGIDPVLEFFPRELCPTGTEQDIRGVTILVEAALDALEARHMQPAAFKPNIGYFSACDRPLEVHLSLEERFAGTLALADVIGILRKRMPRVPLILDSKRGDIARSSRNYAVEAYHRWRADAVTVSPWMGDDSVRPFLETGTAGTGLYLLVRTSNPGAARFQNVPASDRPMYRRVLDVIREWGGGALGAGGAGGGLGAVVGATAPEELAEIAGALRDDPIPLLIPGVGRQGGTAEEVLRVVRETAYPPELVRVNISGGALFPWGGDEAPHDWRAALGEAVLGACRDLALDREPARGRSRSRGRGPTP